MIWKSSFVHSYTLMNYIIFMVLGRKIKNYTCKTGDLYNIFSVLYTPGSMWKAVVSNFLKILSSTKEKNIIIIKRACSHKYCEYSNYLLINRQDPLYRFDLVICTIGLVISPNNHNKKDFILFLEIIKHSGSHPWAVLPVLKGCPAAHIQVVIEAFLQLM